MMIFGTSKSGPRAYLASFGAALGIVALATNPFAQATISLYSCMRNGTESASIPRANHFSVEREGYNEMDARTFDAPMQLASYRGLLEPPENRSTSVTVSCTSGNCTFPSHDDASFLSLTMCSRAWDISDRIAINDTKINYVYSIGPEVTLSEKSVFAMDYVEAPDTGFSASKYDHWNRTSIVDVYILSMTKDNSTDCIAPQCLSFMGGHFKPSAFVFSLFPCIHTVYATMKYGRYEEKVVSEQYLHWISRADGGTYQLAVNRTMMDGTWQDCVGTTTANSMNTVAVYVKKDSATEPSKMWYAPECVFGFTGSTALSQFLGPSLFRTKSQTETARSSWVSKLWRNGTTDLALVANFAEGLATSLGAHMRASASGPDMLREARGTTQLTKTCFNIRWGYVAFFVSIYTLELLFLATLIVMSYKSKVHTDWKSSSLAIAFLTAENTRRPELHADDPNSEESLRQAAQSVQAQLCDESGHWQLRTRRRV
ncbi:hypothetical protein PWT90_06779 [Aphanocladium album]|nr:hypothetical protein PWT90_06779 [Aphanocladium album]